MQLSKCGYFCRTLIEANAIQKRQLFIRSERIWCCCVRSVCVCVSQTKCNYYDVTFERQSHNFFYLHIDASTIFCESFCECERARWESRLFLPNLKLRLYLFKTHYLRACYNVLENVLDKSHEMHLNKEVNRHSNARATDDTKMYESRAKKKRERNNVPFQAHTYMS